VVIALSGPATLEDLAAAINANSSSPASASIVETAPDEFRLVLTGKDTGAANTFSVVATGLSGSALTFGGNTVNASNATLTINGLAVESDSNTVDAGIPGVTLDLLSANSQKTVVVNVARDNQALIAKVEAFATAYNDLVKFATEQTAAASKGTTGTLGRDAVLRSVRNELRSALSGAFGSGAYTTLSQVGIGFDKTGKLTVDTAALADALTANPSAVEGLFANPSSGAFKAIDAILDEYTQAGGFVPNARTRLSDEVRRLGQRSDDLSARLAVRRSALQKEFIAADLAMSRLNAQKSALEGFATSLSSLF
jgi:flagellar hook-associated protein 2